MELLRNLFEGYPNLWGGGVAHSVLILSLVITFGIMLGKLKVAGISLGVTWILFVGIVFGHFDMNLDEHLLHFLKEFGLILFVYSIGLQVGPGFFSAFKKGGLTLNMVAMLSVFLSVLHIWESWSLLDTACLHVSQGFRLCIPGQPCFRFHL